MKWWVVALSHGSRSSPPRTHLLQLLIQWIPGHLPLGATRLEREVDHSSQYEIKIAWSFTSSSPYVFTVWFLDTATILSFLLMRLYSRRNLPLYYTHDSTLTITDHRLKTYLIKTYDYVMFHVCEICDIFLSNFSSASLSLLATLSTMHLCTDGPNPIIQFYQTPLQQALTVGYSLHSFNAVAK
jgi:hypothetical protein